jgi:glycine/D-amino acid oxidase-like deaminating enzyme
MDDCFLDVLVIGGGVAGLWLLDELRRAGFSVLLVETKSLGSGQTIPSQGILHGGFKHAIGGRERAYVRTLNRMPEIWRACLSGEREPDLSDVTLRGAFHYCWRTRSIGAIFGQIGARFGLNVDLARIAPDDRPPPLWNCPGDVFRLDEQIVDPRSLISVLAERNKTSIVHAHGIQLLPSAPGRIEEVQIASSGFSNFARLHPRNVILTAGEGNAALREASGLHPGVMQRLPLSILVVRGKLPHLNGFCIDGTHAKAIITCQSVRDEMVWQVGTESVKSLDPDFKEAAWREVYEALPGFEWPKISLSTYQTNRAEVVEQGASRSDGVQILTDGNVITAWPTKLVLAPLLAEKILGQLDSPLVRMSAPSAFSSWPRPSVAPSPWDE